MKSTPLFEPKVRLDEEQHRYFDSAGLEYMGFSAFYELLCKPFAKTPIAMQKAFSLGVSKESVLAEWEQKKELGTYYDTALTECAKDPKAISNYPEISELITSVLGEYKDYWETYEKVVCYNTQYQIAGEIDKCGVSSHRTGSTFDCSDFKTYEKPQDLYISRGWLFEPLSHLPASKFTQVALQLSFYSLQLETLTGRRCKNLFIHIINPITKTHDKVYVPYLRTDVTLALEFNKDKIRTLVAKQESLF